MSFNRIKIESEKLSPHCTDIAETLESIAQFHLLLCLSCNRWIQQLHRRALIRNKWNTVGVAGKALTTGHSAGGWIHASCYCCSHRCCCWLWFAFLYYTHIFFCASKTVYGNEHCSCIPINTTVSNLRRRLDWCCSLSANALTLPASSCERLMWQDGRGQLKYLEGQGKVAEVSAKPASQLSSITANRCWQLDSLEMQSNHLGRPMVFWKLQRHRDRALPMPDVRSMKVTLPVLEKTVPKQRPHVANLHGD